MVKVALWVKLEAKPGKENDVQAFLNSGLALVEQEPATTVWFAIKMGPGRSASSMRSRTMRVERRT